MAGGELAHIGGIKTRARALFLKTTPKKKKWFLSSFPLQLKSFEKYLRGKWGGG